MSSIEKDSTEEKKDKWYFYRRGDKLYDDEEYEDALQEFIKALELDPEFIDALHMTGVCLERLRKYDDAFFFYTKNISKDPNYTYSQYGAGNMMYRLRRYNQALEFFQKCVELEKDFTIGYNSLGLTFEKLGNIPRARDNLRKAVELDGSRDDFKENLSDLSKTKVNVIKKEKEGMRHYQQKEYAKALNAYDQIIISDPKNVEAWHMRGLQHEHLRNYTEALLNYTHAAKLDPKYFRSVLGMANMHFILGNLNLAKKHYSIVLKLDPNNQQATDNLKMIKERYQARVPSIYISYAAMDVYDFKINEVKDLLHQYGKFRKIYYYYIREDLNEHRSLYFDRILKCFDFIVVFFSSNTKSHTMKTAEWRAAMSSNKEILVIYEKIEDVPLILQKTYKGAYHIEYDHADIQDLAKEISVKISVYMKNKRLYEK
ncbi:MAG: tetratricopeptide repeat protein [Candidatus Lokiarchaeota archaeon]|nr:tetratricopeptide repeat protein [Candidatus Lokiarchaeota archaeon]